MGYSGSSPELPHLLCCAPGNIHDCGQSYYILSDVSAITNNIQTANKEIHQMATAILTPLSKNASSTTSRNFLKWLPSGLRTWFKVFSDNLSSSYLHENLPH